MNTGQITRAQTFLFLSNMNPLPIVIGIVVSILFLISLIIYAIKKKVVSRDTHDKHHRYIKISLIILILILITTFLINVLWLKIENPLIKTPEELISYQFEDQILSKEISNINLTLNNPNVVFFLLESISTERVGFYGYPKNVSPNIDNLAKKSIVFSNAYTTSTHSDYAQPAILSSRYLLTTNTRTDFEDKNPRKFIWDIFKEKEYNTSYFSSQDDRWQGMIKYFNHSNLDVYSYSMTDGKTDYGYGYAKKDLDHKTANLAIEWLNETKNPFFLLLNFQATHNPLVHPKEYEIFLPESNIENKYDNSLYYVDAQIGRILEEIDKKGISNNTIIIITSDHGHDLLNIHNIDGHGNSLYNDELKVPALIYIPNVKPTIIKEKTSNIDILPSLLDLLNFKIPKEFQGDIMKENRPIYSVTQSNKYLISLIKGDIKVIADLNRDLIEIYNLTEDPQENNNLNWKEYKKEILQLLLWDYCQKEYYKKELWKSPEKNRCLEFNNFKI